MSRYIDADGFFETFSELDIVPYNTYPSTDVLENVKGEWIEVIDIGYHGWRCNLCGEDSYRKSNFCPNCGADMRGER